MLAYLDEKGTVSRRPFVVVKRQLGSHPAVLLAFSPHPTRKNLTQGRSSPRPRVRHLASLSTVLTLRPGQSPDRRTDCHTEKVCLSATFVPSVRRG